MGISISENLTALVSACILTVTSAVSISDASTTRVGIHINVSDGITVGITSVDKSESIAIGESTTAVISPHNVVVSQSVSISEDVDVDVPLLDADNSNSVTVSESVNATVVNCIGVSDSISVGEDIDVDAGITGPVSVSESISLSEYEKTELEIHVDVEDGIVVGITSVDTSDSVTVGEDITVAFLYWQIAVSDSVSLSPSANTSTQPAGVSVSDSIAITESAEGIGGVNGETSSSVAVGESASVLVGACVIDVTDPITIAGDSNTVLGDFAWSVEDSISVIDAAVVAFDSLTVDVSDTISIGKEAAFEITRFVEKSESLTIGESAEAAISGPVIAVSDSIAVSELVDTYFELSPSVSDGTSITESVKGSWDLNASASESITVNDEAISGDLTPSVSQPISISESVGILLREKKQEIDLTLYLDTAKGYNFSINTAEGITLHIKRTYSREFIR